MFIIIKFCYKCRERAVAAFAEFILANPKMPTVTRLNTFNQTLLAIEHGYSKVITRKVVRVLTP